MNTFTFNGKQYTYKQFIAYSIATHSGKMSGIPSISTSVLCNRQCAEHAAVKGSICEKCFARGYAKMRKQLAEKLKANYEFYTTVNLCGEDVPFINSAIFRFESFGDLANVQQFANYCTIARNNIRTTFVLWTKNHFIIEEYIKCGGIIPSNLYIIASSLMLNNPRVELWNASELEQNKLMPFIDAVFTVYDERTIKAENIDINCGGRKCIECRKCYSLKHGEIAEIREQLK